MSQRNASILRHGRVRVDDSVVGLDQKFRQKASSQCQM